MILKKKKPDNFFVYLVLIKNENQLKEREKKTCFGFWRFSIFPYQYQNKNNRKFLHFFLL